MSALNWGLIQGGGAFESLMHALLSTRNDIISFGRPGQDAGQDACSADGETVYQAKYRQHLTMDGAIEIALGELSNIKKYRNSQHSNYVHWKNAHRWVLVANFSVNPNDLEKWRTKVVPKFQKEGLAVDYWDIEVLESELAKNPHIRDVFFEGENRVLMGLKEAHDLLLNESIGSGSLEKPAIGLDAEIEAIESFVNNDGQRVLPVIGSPGIGKSRFIYESLVMLGQNGWQVLWALPESMSRSSKWFHLLNSNQPTCVAIDDPSDLNLLKAIIEQLAPIERRNWKVILACRSTQAKFLRPFQKLALMAEPLVLEPLGEEDSKKLLVSHCVHSLEASGYHTIYKHTGGVPGWLCLVAKLINRDALHQFGNSVDEIASLYVADCFNNLDENQRQDGILLLRYISLWGTFCFDETAPDQSQMSFLSSQGLNRSRIQELLIRLVKTGIVRNWGFGKRLFAIQPLILREHVLSQWLFTAEDEEYHANAEGKRMIDLLASGTIPKVGLALRSISNLSRSRLNPSQGYNFLKPVFDELKSKACEGTILDQAQLIRLVEIIGPSDPESALDCIKAIRENDKNSVEVDDSIWGKVTIERKSVVAKLPWLLFETAGFVTESAVAARFLEEFRCLVQGESSFEDEIEAGNRPRNLVHRILCESKNAIVFAEPAKNAIIQGMSDTANWPFVGTLLESLLNPEREYTEWTAKWTITMRRSSIIPDRSEWNIAKMLREVAFQFLQTSMELELRAKIWRILTESHHQFHRLVQHGRTQETSLKAYRDVLLGDLSTAAYILNSPPVEMTIEETVAARRMWDWYLEYGKDDDLKRLANKCEETCKTLSGWRLQDFFRFDTDEALALETTRVATVLREVTDIQPFGDFFSTVERYLSAARTGGQDMADSGRIAALADAISETFTPSKVGGNEETPTTKYITTVLGEAQATNDFAWQFAIRICQKHILQIKTSGNNQSVVLKLKLMLSFCHVSKRGRFLFDLYSNPHPLNTGDLGLGELELLAEHEPDFSVREMFVLLGAFAPILWDSVLPHLTRLVATIKEHVRELDHHVFVVVRMIRLSALRYKKHDLTRQINWIIEAIIEHNLDGSILGDYALTWLRKESDFRLSLSQVAQLLTERIGLEAKPKSHGSFQLLPFEFPISEWCRMDASAKDDIASFHKLCDLGLTNGYIGYHRIPNFLPELDTSGEMVAQFVEKKLDSNPTISSDVLARLAYLASGYADTSKPWALIAAPICRKVANLSREERERVFFGLSRKETGVLTSMPGEVPSYYSEIRDAAIRMQSLEQRDSVLKGYREWAVRRAESELRQQRQMTEELGDE